MTMRILIRKAVEVIKEVLNVHPGSIGYSGGKDSSVLVSLTFIAARELAEAGETVMPIFVMHADTEIENPSIAHHNRLEIRKIRDFAEKHSLPVSVEIGRPTTASSWLNRTVGQGKLPVWPGDKQDCTEEYKLKVQRRLRNKVMKKIAELTKEKPVVMTGVRFEESTQREKKMRERGDNASEVIVTKGNELYLAPIANWTEDDIWNFIAIAGQGKAFDNYTDFQMTMDVYGAASPASCPVLGDEILGETKRVRGGCGSRFGCWACAYVGVDRSMVNLIQNQPATYGYMRYLNAIQNWLSAIRYDFDSRSWLPRSINKAGYIRVQPDLLGPRQMEALFRYVVTADVIEAEDAEKNRDEPRFQTADLQKVIAVDASWSQLGFFPPFHAIKLYKDIVEGGERYFAPKIESFPRVQRPSARYVYVGNIWEDESVHHKHLLTFDELRNLGGIDTLADLFAQEVNPCRITHNTDNTFSVDKEAAELFMYFEADRQIEAHHKNWEERANWSRDITEGYKYYLRTGIIALAKGRQEKSSAEILRRTYFRDALGLCGPDIDVSVLLEKSISQSEMDAIMDEVKAKEASQKKAEEDRIADLDAFNGTEAGQYQLRIAKMIEAAHRVELCYQRIIQSEAYLALSKADGHSPVFDGVNYADLLFLAQKELKKSTRKWVRNAEMMSVFEERRKAMYSLAIKVLDNNYQILPEGWFTLIFLRSWSRSAKAKKAIIDTRANWKKQMMGDNNCQMELFAA